VRSPTTLDSVLPFLSKAISMRSPLISIISTCSPLKVAEEKKESLSACVLPANFRAWSL